jgi:hypothetical protein
MIVPFVEMGHLEAVPEGGVQHVEHADQPPHPRGQPQYQLQGGQRKYDQFLINLLGAFMSTTPEKHTATALPFSPTGKTSAAAHW